MKKMQYVFLDSGIGGLPYLDLFIEQNPCADVVYVADTAHFPYGSKSVQEITDAVTQVTAQIIQRYNPDVIALACNTMSVTALDALRSQFAPFFVGTVPAIKPAVETTKKNRIGLLATEQTIAHPYTHALINTFAQAVFVDARADAPLIRFIEETLAFSSASQIDAAIAPAVAYFTQARVDVVVLGCTHFLHVKKELSCKLGSTITVIDSQVGVVNRMASLSPVRAHSHGRRLMHVTGNLSPQKDQQYRRYAQNYGLVWSSLL